VGKAGSKEMPSAVIKSKVTKNYAYLLKGSRYDKREDPESLPAVKNIVA
jgi:hypothetical protein